MSYQLIADTLYREILIISVVLIIILLINNLVLFKQKLTSLFSLMLLFGLAACVAELILDILDGNPQKTSLIYLVGGVFTMLLLDFTACLNRYFMEQFGIVMKKWQIFLFYVLPNIVIFVLCITSPWTHLFLGVDEEGFIVEYILYLVLFDILEWTYIAVAILLAVNYMITAPKKDKHLAEMARSLVIYAFLFPVVYMLQIPLTGDGRYDFVSVSLVLAVPLVYLTANINMHALLQSREKIEAVEAELSVAAKIQMDAMPIASPVFEDHPEISLKALMVTAKEVGGDFYDYFFIDDDRLCFLIADVSGKGVPAAMFMMTVKTMIRDHAIMNGSTAEVFTAVNVSLCENNDVEMFATAWIGILDTRTKKLQYTNAGHNYPVLFRQGQPPELLAKRHGLFLAGMEETTYRFDELMLNPGDRLLLYTDGVTEAQNTEKELYETRRLFATLEADNGKDCEDTLKAVLDSVNKFADGEPQSDDITMVMLEV